MATLRESPTSFVGRHREISELESLLEGGARLVTLLGPGGAGKTRLARRVLARLSGVFVDLSTARTSAEIVAVLSRALEIEVVESAADAEARIVEALAHAKPLLVLDNLEQIAAIATPLVVRWLDAAPGWRAIVTSRERLGAEAEHILQLDAMARPEAIALFVERAQEAGWRDASTGDPVIAELCRHLDDLPLAIELAAARVSLLSPNDILARLDERFRILRTGRRDAFDRHATLWNAIAWSWDLLEPDESAALRQLSVFEGGFTLPAAAAVVESDSDLLDLFERLAARSLLRVAAPRYSLHESVRAFASDKLTAAEDGGAEQRHASYFVSFAEHLVGAGELGRLGVGLDASLVPEIPNLTRVAEQSPDAGLRVRACLILATVFHTIGPSERRLEVLDRATTSATDPRLRRRLLAARGFTFLSTVRYAEAEAAYAEAVGLARAEGDTRAEADCLVGQSAAHLYLGDSGRALSHHDEAMALYPATAPIPPFAYLTRGMIMTTLDRLDDADACYLELIQAAQARGDASMDVAHAYRHRSTLRIIQGRWSEAEVDAQAALEAFRRNESRRFEGLQLAALGEVHLMMGRTDEALVELDDATKLLHAIGNFAWEAIHHVARGTGFVDLVRYDDARRALDRALETRDLAPVIRATALIYKARVVQLQGELEEALTLTGMAGAVAERARDPAVEAFSLAVETTILADLDRVEAAQARLDTLRARLPIPDGQILEAFVHLSEGHLALAHARRAPEEADAYLDEAGTRLGVAHEIVVTPRHPRLLPVQLRAAKKLLARRLEDAVGQSPRPLTLDLQAAWCITPEGRRVDLSKKTTLRRMLLAIAHERARGGPGLSVDALVVATWPGEHIDAVAGANRVYVSLSSLRKAGLEGLIERTAEGYLLTVPVKFE